MRVKPILEKKKRKENVVNNKSIEEGDEHLPRKIDKI